MEFHPIVINPTTVYGSVPSEQDREDADERVNSCFQNFISRISEICGYSRQTNEDLMGCMQSPICHRVTHAWTIISCTTLGVFIFYILYKLSMEYPPSSP